ncbi:MAG: chorismate lyase [Gammaproteobacteria bacterium]|nr:chorismate lyase [Gammaproteobacteria bacterium]
MIARHLLHPGRHGVTGATLQLAAHRAEPVWHVALRLHRREVPDDVLHWLLDPASLTQRIRVACAGRFAVDVLEQGFLRPQQNESAHLDMRAATRAFVREVHLLCNGAPWVFARTVIPRTTLVGMNRRLTRLKNRPLGAVLFADPSMKRGPVEIARLLPGDALYHDATQHLSVLPDRIWGRRSIFMLAGKPLLVSEFFLPGVPPCR